MGGGEAHKSLTCPPPPQNTPPPPPPPLFLSPFLSVPLSLYHSTHRVLAGRSRKKLRKAKGRRKKAKVKKAVEKGSVEKLWRESFS